MLVSCPVDAECILSPAKLAALLAVVAIGEYMLGLNVVPHIGWLLAGVITIQTLPQTSPILPHLCFYSTVSYNKINKNNLSKKGIPLKSK